MSALAADGSAHAIKNNGRLILRINDRRSMLLIPDIVGYIDNAQTRSDDGQHAEGELKECLVEHALIISFLKIANKLPPPTPLRCNFDGVDNRGLKRARR